MEESAAASESMQAQAADLSRLVSVFKLDAQTSVAVSTATLLSSRQAKPVIAAQPRRNAPPSTANAGAWEQF